MADCQLLIVDYLSTKSLRRLFRRITVDRLTGCWNWTGALDPHYGIVSYHGRMEKVHRLMYAWLVAPLPMGIAARKFAQLDHAVCNNKRCCNPVHLALVTQQINSTRNGGTAAANSRKTHCKRGHVLPPPTDRAGRNNCRQCSSNRHKARLRGPDRERYLAIGRRAQQRLRDKRRNER